MIAFRGGAMDEQASDVADWPTEKGSSALSAAVLRKLVSLGDAERTKVAQFVGDNFSWDKTFSRQIKIYES